MKKKRQKPLKSIRLKMYTKKIIEQRKTLREFQFIANNKSQIVSVKITIVIGLEWKMKKNFME